MKKAMFILSTVLMLGFLSSCSTEELTVKKNWIFTVTTVSTMTPDDMGVGPQTVVTTVEQSGLTEAEANAVIKQMSTTTTQTAGGYTMTMTVTVTKAEKK